MTTKGIPLLASLLLSVFLLCSQVIAQENTILICIGQDENKCPFAHQAWFHCGVTEDQAGRSVCTIHTQNGETVRNFQSLHSQDVSGGMCGYLQLKITCLN